MMHPCASSIHVILSIVEALEMADWMHFLQRVTLRRRPQNASFKAF